MATQASLGLKIVNVYTFMISTFIIEKWCGAMVKELNLQSGGTGDSSLPICNLYIIQAPSQGS